MGRRSSFPRIEQDSYPKPLAAAIPLLDRLPAGTQFIEPCCGEGRLVEHLEAAGHVCVGRYDLPIDVTIARYPEATPGVVMITNPPWRGDVLHPLIVNLSTQAPTWLLIDFDWLATRQACPYLPRLRDIVIIGRCRWIEGSPYTSKDSGMLGLVRSPVP